MEIKCYVCPNCKSVLYIYNYEIYSSLLFAGIIKEPLKPGKIKLHLELDGDFDLSTNIFSVPEICTNLLFDKNSKLTLKAYCDNCGKEFKITQFDNGMNIINLEQLEEISVQIPIIFGN